MQYLVICRLNGSPTPEAMRSFMETCDLCGSFQATGVVKAFGPFSDLTGGVMIVDVPSNDELASMLAQMPVKPYISTEIIPLTSPEALKEIGQKMKLPAV